MPHEIHRVTSFQQIAPFTLTIEFEDGTSQTINFRSVLEGELFRPLQDPTLFSQVRIDPEIHTLVWPNGADFDPAILQTGPSQDRHSRL
jgi:Protein of unknown function (DUF2442)